eukprot:TRINITY_DN2179_c0_g1_i1.p1 TRINITY_DN2179_c0_g1~~TRINITY_DN2179_c0_g1_i1.p1  ORF type:complete len:210 (+),score=4.66 TRINITY_DN2179_c0_g1_i1:74-703(+)
MCIINIEKNELLERRSGLDLKIDFLLNIQQFIFRFLYKQWDQRSQMQQLEVGSIIQLFFIQLQLLKFQVKFLGCGLLQFSELVRPIIWLRKIRTNAAHCLQYIHFAEGEINDFYKVKIIDLTYGKIIDCAFGEMNGQNLKNNSAAWSTLPVTALRLRMELKPIQRKQNSMKNLQHHLSHKKLRQQEKKIIGVCFKGVIVRHFGLQHGRK